MRWPRLSTASPRVYGTRAENCSVVVTARRLRPPAQGCRSGYHGDRIRIRLKSPSADYADYADKRKTGGRSWKQKQDHGSALFVLLLPTAPHLGFGICEICVICGYFRLLSRLYRA